jgi:hypothetical protein
LDEICKFAGLLLFIAVVGERCGVLCGYAAAVRVEGQSTTRQGVGALRDRLMWALGQSLCGRCGCDCGEWLVSGAASCAAARRRCGWGPLE